MRKISEINTDILNKICGKVADLRHCHEKAIAQLPDQLRPHCAVANFEKGILKLAVASAVWATKLRYSIPDILEKLRQEEAFKGLVSIEYYIAPNFHQLFREMPSLSDKTKK